MYKIYKGVNYFGVCYNDVEMAIIVAKIFEETLGCKFIVREERE